jgi:hypothetical protein
MSIPVDIQPDHRIEHVDFDCDHCGEAITNGDDMVEVPSPYPNESPRFYCCQNCVDNHDEDAGVRAAETNIANGPKSEPGRNW